MISFITCVLFYIAYLLNAIYVDDLEEFDETQCYAPGKHPNIDILNLTTIMKRSILLLLAITLCSTVYAQRCDSLPIPGGYLFYHVYGKGKPVVILTGGPGISCGQQEDVAMHISNEYQAILIEQRGTGRSIPTLMDKEHINIDTAAADIKKILDKLAIKQAAIYGHSYGSLLAMYFGTRYPERVSRLIFAGPAPFNYTSDQLSTYADNKDARLGFSDIQQLNALDEKAGAGTLTAADSFAFRRINNSTIIFDKSRLDSIMRFVSKGKINNKMMVLMAGSYMRLDLTSQVKKFAKPIYIICGKQDALSFMAYEYKLVKPDVKIHWIKQAGHFPMFEQEKDFYNALTASLN